MLAHRQSDAAARFGDCPRWMPALTVRSVRAMADDLRGRSVGTGPAVAIGVT
jgi:hypothetical protein